MFIILLISVVLLCCSDFGVKSEQLVEFLKWKQIEYKLPRFGTPDFMYPDRYKRYLYNYERQNEFDYIPYNNVPMGVTHYKGKLFITIPRRRPGVLSTLNYIDLSMVKPGDDSPKLIAYPNYDANRLHPVLLADRHRIISVYRTRVDSCNRLWFVDTGALEYPNNDTIIQRPSLWIIDLDSDILIRRYEIPRNIAKDGRGIASVTVDVDYGLCNDAYAYIPNLIYKALYVYSFRTNRMWTFYHNYFSFDPLWGDINIAGQSFQWDDGIFSITLGNKNPDGYRTAYFHAMMSISEFTVSTKVLRNETNAERLFHGKDFKHLGFRGPLKQTTMHEFDPITETIFFAEISQYGIGCWNTNKPFIEEYQGTVQQNKMKMIYPSDLTIDQDGILWVMTNSLPIFMYSNLNTNEYNFRIWRQSCRNAIEDTICKMYPSNGIAEIW